MSAQLEASKPAPQLAKQKISRFFRFSVWVFIARSPYLRTQSEKWSQTVIDVSNSLDFVTEPN
jgi:hypothetical protein